MAEAVLYITALALQYAACVSLYHADPRRTDIAQVVSSPSKQQAFKGGGWLILLLTIWLLSIQLGVERGITIAIGCVGIAGFASLFVKAYLPNKHIFTGVVAMIVSFMAGVLLVMTRG